MADAAPKRIVPGAPPPLPLTKSQLKKRKKTTAARKANGDDQISTPKDAALVDHVPATLSPSLVVGDDEKAASTAPDATVPEPELHPSTIALETQKTPSPIVDQIINKRIKVLGKKIVRGSGVCILSRWASHLIMLSLIATHAPLLV